MLFNLTHGFTTFFYFWLKLRHCAIDCTYIHINSHPEGYHLFIETDFRTINLLIRIVQNDSNSDRLQLAIVSNFFLQKALTINLPRGLLHPQGKGWKPLFCLSDRRMASHFGFRGKTSRSTQKHDTFQDGKIP